MDDNATELTRIRFSAFTISSQNLANGIENTTRIPIARTSPYEGDARTDINRKSISSTLRNVLIAYEY